MAPGFVWSSLHVVHFSCWVFCRLPRLTSLPRAGPGFQQNGWTTTGLISPGTDVGDIVPPFRGGTVTMQLLHYTMSIPSASRGATGRCWKLHLRRQKTYGGSLIHPSAATFGVEMRRTSNRPDRLLEHTLDYPNFSSRPAQKPLVPPRRTNLDATVATDIPLQFPRTAS